MGKKFYLISKEELDAIIVSVAEDDEDKGAIALRDKIVSNTSNIVAVIKQADGMLGKAIDPLHCDDLNCIIDNLEEMFGD